MSDYDHQKIEAKWRQQWLKAKTHQPDLKQSQKPFYNLMMFPYPSAEGLHVGNMYAFTGADVYGRFQRMQGNDVFEPIGLDGFGIHSENYAIQIGKHPAEQAKISQQRFYDQLSRIGNGFAWDYRLETYDPDYYRWTQWLFIQMFKHGLAYRGTAMVNWCPSCKTVLADEQVEAGVCERCKTQVTRKKMEQWFFRITDYADQLLANIDKIDWPEKIKTAQRNWIGRSEGINITYEIIGTNQTITCFTTTPVNWGATFIVIAIEHPLLERIPIAAKYEKKVKDYIKTSLNKTEQDRKTGGKEKTGVFTGLYAKNHVTGKKIPIWVADFVLMDVGTGAVQGCPGHDKRDFEFAQKYDLPIPRVVVGPDGDESEIDSIEKVIESGTPGKMINSDFLNGMDFAQAMQKTMDYFEKKGWGKRVVTYHLRDWLISRQRYWGSPIPMIYCSQCKSQNKGERSDMPGWYSVPEEDLPVKLPYVKDYKPKGDGKAPLANAPRQWLEVNCPECGTAAQRETDVIDTFPDSSWYFLAYPNVRSREWKQGPSPFNLQITKKWLPVNAYIGGAEHAVLHLLYSRFVTMALKDWGYLDFAEPFPFLFSHGLIIKDGAKMSKSRGNVVVPDEYIAKYGADTLRMYLMFLGPYDQGGDFRDTGIAGMGRFLTRVWNTFNHQEKVGQETSAGLINILHQTIRKMTEDIPKFKYNTAIATFMELINAWRENGAKLSQADAIKVIKLIAPFTPYMAEELFQQLRSSSTQSFQSVHLEPWPEYDPRLIQEGKVVIIIQVNGKIRDQLEIEPEKANQDTVVKLAQQSQKVANWLHDKKITNTIWVAPKDKKNQGLVNFVV